ncbi:MAG TPA: CehA/McbA family metallohydrolase, partial [bacterium]|nr:CehA/McbA family metallohydrolase [bacterium]
GVHQIASAADLIGGPGAQAVVGDWLLQNDKIRAIVQDVGASQMQLGTFGGNLIDADVVRTGGAPGNDTLGQVIPLMSLGYTSHPNKVIVVNDGSDGGAAILRTCGPGDVYQYLDLSATFAEFGVGTHYKTSQTFPGVEFTNDYVLAPGSNTVEIITTISNHGGSIFVPMGDVIDSGSASEIWNTNDMGFGSAGFGALYSTPPPTQYMGFLAPGSGWGYVNDADPNIAVTIAGVTVLQQDFVSVFDMVGSNPASGARPGLALLPHNGKMSYHRGIVVTDGTNGVNPVASVYYQRHKPAAKAHTGTVLDDAASPVAGVRIVALSDSAGNLAANAKPQNVTETDSAGNYTLTLPPGKYFIAADAPGRPWPTYSGTGVTTQNVSTSFSGNTFPAAEVTFTAAEAAPDITFTKPAHVSVTVTETGTGAPIPSRIVVTGTDPSPGDSVFRDPKEQTSSAIAFNAISKDGTFAFDIEPGSYDVYATHGPEYSVSSSGTLALTAGSTPNVSLNIGRVIDVSGWISGDFHIHMVNSPDSYVPLIDRTIDGAAEGLAVMVTTDHDYITDLNGIIGNLGLASNMICVPGEEVTTWDMGHFNVWPLAADTTHPADDGAYKWANGPGANKTAKDIFEDIAAKYAPATVVKQVNHPREGGGSSPTFILQQYYSAIGLDTATLKTTTDPAFLRLPVQAGATADDTKLFYDKFNAQEVQNGFDAPNIRWSDLNDLMSFLSHGMRVAGTGNSDSHKLFSNQLGYPRNYVMLADNVPSHLTGANREAFAQAIVKGQTFFSQGPFFKDVTVHGMTDGHAGDLIKPSGSTVTVDATVQWPAWLGVDTLHIYMNTPNTTTIPANDGNPNQPAAAKTVDLTAIATVKTATNGLPYYEAVIPTQTLTLPSTDAWILVDVDAENPATKSLFPIIPVGVDNGSGERPYALYNAVYVDVNGNGTFDPTGPTFTADYRRPAPRVLKHFDPDSIPPEGTPEIRAQFEAIAAGQCRGESTNGKKGMMDRGESNP